jgi:hypothetical protein
MNNLVKILLGLLFVFIIILCILKQPLNKCPHHKEGLAPNDQEGLEKGVQNIEKILQNMKTSVASQSSADMIINLLNDMKKNISDMKTDIETMKVKIR